MRSHGHYFQTCLVHALHAAGHLPEATSLLAEIEPPGGGFPKIWFLETSAQIALARGDIPSVVAAITAAMPIEGAVTYPHGTHFLPQAAEVSLAAGNITEARQRTDQACQLSSEKGNGVDRLHVAAAGLHIEAEAALQRRIRRHRRNLCVPRQAAVRRPVTLWLLYLCVRRVELDQPVCSSPAGWR